MSGSYFGIALESTGCTHVWLPVEFGRHSYCALKAAGLLTNPAHIKPILICRKASGIVTKEHAPAAGPAGLSASKCKIAGRCRWICLEPDLARIGASARPK